MSKKSIIETIRRIDESIGSETDIENLKGLSIKELRDILKKDYDESEVFEYKASNKSNKNKNTKVASLRSSKDKKFMGHTGRG